MPMNLFDNTLSSLLQFSHYVLESRKWFGISGYVNLIMSISTTSHKWVDGVPKFAFETPILSTCPTCVQAKQTKSSTGPNSTRSATRPYQVLSIDFSFSGMASKDDTVVLITKVSMMRLVGFLLRITLQEPSMVIVVFRKRRQWNGFGIS